MHGSQNPMVPFDNSLYWTHGQPSICTTTARIVQTSSPHNGKTTTFQKSGRLPPTLPLLSLSYRVQLTAISCAAQTICTSRPMPLLAAIVDHIAGLAVNAPDEPDCFFLKIRLGNLIQVETNLPYVAFVALPYVLCIGIFAFAYVVWFYVCVNVFGVSLEVAEASPIGVNHRSPNARSTCPRRCRFRFRFACR